MILFGTPIMVYDNLIPEALRRILIDTSSEIMKNTESGDADWRCDVYTTCHKYNLLDDSDFNELHNKTHDKMEHFLTTHGIEVGLSPSFSWVNAYTSKQFQDTHKHPNCLVSTVYFLEAPEGSAPLVMHSPYIPDVLYEKVTGKYLREAHSVKAVSNRLVVFPSWLPHSVPQGSNEELRYTIATNFERRQPNGISPTQNPTEA